MPPRHLSSRSALLRALKSCEAKAVSKDGKPLFGAAKDASIKKCQDDSGITRACEENAISKAGKAVVRRRQRQIDSEVLA